VISILPPGPTPSFQIGAVRVVGDTVLAPMSGLSDLPYRSLCRRFGSALSYTEFVCAREIIHGRGLHWRKAFAFLDCERPVIMQIFDSDEDRLAEAAVRIQELGPDVIDLNMGCSVHRVANGGAGAALLKDPAKVGRIFARLTRAVSCPVSGKIRLGWDSKTRNFLEVVRAMQDNGAAMVAVHARTRAQGYSGQADWEAITRVVESAAIPVIGNGDVQSVEDIVQMKQRTGCCAVMVGRGAVGNPWLFQKRDRRRVPLDEKIQVVLQHFSMMEGFYGPQLAPILMRKHLSKYFAEQPGVRELRGALVRLESGAHLRELLQLVKERFVGAGGISDLPAS
jgi:tRNA-dihydrouridine synthase B